MEVLNVCVNLNALRSQNKNVWTTLQTNENGWDSNFLIECSLFECYAKMWYQTLAKWLPILFGSKLTYLWMKKYNIVVVVFNFDFWKWNELFSSIMCTWEKMCLKKIWNKNLTKFSTFCKFQMIKHCCFPTFLEVPSFVPLKFDVIFKSNFSPCINVCNPIVVMGVGVKCMSPHKMH